MNDNNTENIAQTFGEWAAIAIAKHARKIFKCQSDVLKDKDPEDLHQMRVGMRRLRTAVAGFERAIELPTTVTEKRIGKFARILGVLRDLDVLKEAILTQYQPVLSGGEQKLLDEVLKTLKKRRKSAFSEVQELLKGDRYQTFKQDLHDWIDEPQYQPISEVSIGEVLPDLLLPQIANFLLHPGWWVGVQVTGGTANFHEPLEPDAVRELLDHRGLILHDLRKEAKRTRYQLELFTPCYGESYHNFVLQVKQVQEVLGEIQDGYVFAEFLSDVLAVDVQRKLPELAARLTETRYQQWRAWEGLQKQFLDSKTRHDLRSIVQHP